MKNKTNSIDLSPLARHNGLWLLVLSIGLYLLVSPFADAKTTETQQAIKQDLWLNALSEEASLTSLKPDKNLSGDSKTEDSSLSPDETLPDESKTLDAKAIVDNVAAYVKRVSPPPEKKKPVVAPISIDKDIALLVNQVLEDINKKQALVAEKRPDNLQPELKVVVNEALSNLDEQTSENKPQELARLKVEAGNNDSSCLINKKLRVAIAVGNRAYIKSCIDGGLPVNTVAGTVGETLLHLAAKNGRLNIMLLLLNNKANIDSQDNSKRTPLFYAVSKSQVAAVKLLLDKGANKQIRDKFGAQAYARATNAALRNLLK